jgi:hypothetical protein
MGYFCGVAERLAVLECLRENGQGIVLTEFWRFVVVVWVVAFW